MAKKSMKEPGAGPAIAMAPKDDKGPPDKYEIEDGVRTLERAEEIKNDKRLMPHVHKHIGKKLKSLKELRGLAGQKKLEEDEQDGM